MNWLSRTIDRLDAIDPRRLLLANGVVALLTLVASLVALLGSQTGDARGLDHLEPYLYFNVAASAALAASALLGVIRAASRQLVLRLHTGLLLLLAAFALLRSLSWVARGIPGGAFTWNPVVFAMVLAYPVYLARRVLLPSSVLQRPFVRHAHVYAAGAALVISAAIAWRYVSWRPSPADFADDASAAVASLTVPKAQAEPAVPESPASAAGGSDGTTLLSTSFELSAGEDRSSIRPFVQAGALPWARDARARSGALALNAIPRGNPGDLRYFGTSASAVLLSSQRSADYAPFRVERFSRLQLEFWRLSTSNPSETHNCLGNLVVDYRYDGGEWQTKMVYCGRHRSEPLEWRQSLLDFPTAGHTQLELRFDYEYPPDTHRDQSAVYLIDDLVVRGYR